MYYPQSVIWHLNAGSSGSGSSLHDYFLTRNRLKFGFKYTKFRTKLALFRESLRILFKSPSSWQKRGVIDFYLGVSGKGSWQ
jgi:GT2 family glycosyltransferase